MITRLDRHHDPYVVWDIFAGAKGVLAFDVGANIGQSTKVLARGFSSVLAFEPCWESYEILRNEMPENVTAIQAAVSSVDGTITLAEAATSIQTGQLVSHEGLHWGPVVGRRTVPSITLDALVEEHGVPDFIKIDTEGHEVEVLRGGVDLFREHRPKLVIEVHDAGNEKKIYSMLENYRFTKYVHSALRVNSPIRENHFWLASE